MINVDRAFEKVENGVRLLGKHHKLQGDYDAFILDVADSLRCGIIETSYDRVTVVKDLVEILLAEDLGKKLDLG